MAQVTTNIKGYRQLTEEEQAEMNALKEMEQSIANTLAAVEGKYGNSRHLSIAPQGGIGG